MWVYLELKPVMPLMPIGLFFSGFAKQHFHCDEPFILNATGPLHFCQFSLHGTLALWTCCMSTLCAFYGLHFVQFLTWPLALRTFCTLTSCTSSSLHFRLFALHVEACTSFELSKDSNISTIYEIAKRIRTGLEHKILYRLCPNNIVRGTNFYLKGKVTRTNNYIGFLSNASTYTIANCLGRASANSRPLFENFTYQL